MKLMAGHDQIATGDTIWAKTKRGRLDAKRLQAEQPEMFDRYTHQVPKLDTDRLKQEHPDVYADYQTISINPQKIA